MSETVNGLITIKVIRAPMTTVADLEFRWQGGPIVDISPELFKDALDGVFSTNNPQPGEEFTCGPFRLRCPDKTDQLIRALRVDTTK